MDAKPLPPLEYLRQCLRYEPDTGHLYWLERPVSHFTDERAAKSVNSRVAGKRALTARTGGGLIGHINQVRYSAHRIAYYMGTGELPPNTIDHINGDCTDNRLANLRPATRSENSRNRARNYNATNPTHGVYAAGGKWLAKIKADGKQYVLGTFATLEEAMAARIGAERVLNFHENHGRKSMRLAG